MFIYGKFVITIDAEAGGYDDLTYDRAICEILDVDVIDGEALANLMIYADETREVKIIRIGATTEVNEYDTREDIERRLLQNAIDNVCFGMVFEGDDADTEDDIVEGS
jgi:hypothetical protein